MGFYFISFYFILFYFIFYVFALIIGQFHWAQPLPGPTTQSSHNHIHGGKMPRKNLSQPVECGRWCFHHTCTLLALSLSTLPINSPAKATVCFPLLPNLMLHLASALPNWVPRIHFARSKFQIIAYISAQNFFSTIFQNVDDYTLSSSESLPWSKLCLS